jgi:predicted transcriptional regulator
LKTLGIQRSVAALITYLKNVQESREIEQGSDLRQPEVSIAMRVMREHGWISERDEKGPGKGRPLKVYRLSASIGDIIKHCEEAKLQESAQTMETIHRLRELAA